MRYIVVFLFCVLMQNANAQFDNPAKGLKVSTNGHLLEYSDGSPFFWMGDTAWELFHRLDDKETDFYLETRARQGFNVIQAVVLAELFGLTEPNRNGDLPLIDKNPEKPNEAYFKHVDYVVKKAASLGIFIAMLPTWGDKWSKMWGVEKEIFTSENALIYGKYIGNRYKNQWNIIWVLGGDRNPTTEEHYKIIRNMSKGIKEGDGGKHLFTYHPSGNVSSSSFFHNDTWLDINMTQSSHDERGAPNYLYTIYNYMLNPAKPSLDGECRYEDIPVKFGQMKLDEAYKKNPYEMPDSLTPYGYYNDYDVRRAAYGSVFSGACGHTYGNGSIWCFWDKGRFAPIAVKYSWQKAIYSPGAEDMGYLRKLVEKFGINNLQPDKTAILYDTDISENYVTALCTKDESTILAYSPKGKKFYVSLSKVKGNDLRLSWYNPRNGSYSEKKSISTNNLIYEAVPPSKGDGCDWVLIIENK